MEVVLLAGSRVERAVCVLGLSVQMLYDRGPATVPACAGGQAEGSCRRQTEWLELSWWRQQVVPGSAGVFLCTHCTWSLRGVSLCSL